MKRTWIVEMELVADGVRPISYSAAIEWDGGWHEGGIDDHLVVSNLKRIDKTSRRRSSQSAAMVRA